MTSNNLHAILLRWAVRTGWLLTLLLAVSTPALAQTPASKPGVPAAGPVQPSAPASKKSVPPATAPSTTAPSAPSAPPTKASATPAAKTTDKAPAAPTTKTPAAPPAKAPTAPAATVAPTPPAKRTAPNRSAGPSGDQARKLFVEGQNAFAAGEYQKAIDLFRRVDDLAPRAELEYNIALAYDQLKDPAAALAAYRSYLRRAPDSPDRAEVEAQIVRLERQLGKTLQQQLTVVTEPAGATLLVNAVPVGFSPWTGELPTGRHQVVARHEGRLQAVREVSLTAEQAVQVTLALPVDAALIAEREAALRRERELQAERERPTGLARIRPLTWGIVGAGAAGLVGAAAFEQARANSEDDARLSQTQVVAEQEIERAQTHQTTSQVLLGVGVGAAVLGGVFVYIDLTRPDEKQTRLGAGCATRGCSVFARGRF